LNHRAQIQLREDYKNQNIRSAKKTYAAYVKHKSNQEEKNLKCNHTARFRQGEIFEKIQIPSFADFIFLLA